MAAKNKAKKSPKKMIRPNGKSKDSVREKKQDDKACVDEEMENRIKTLLSAHRDMFLYLAEKLKSPLKVAGTMHYITLLMMRAESDFIQGSSNGN